MAETPDRSLAGDSLGRDAQGRPILIGASCTACGTQFFPAAPVCPTCAGESIAPAEMPRHGILYSHTTVHAGPPRWRKPMRLGYIDLPNGVRLLAHLHGDPAIGDTLTLDTAILADDPSGPLTGFIFRPEA